MSYIYHALSADDIVDQIAAMLNTHSDLAMKRIGEDIKRSNVDYIVETHGKYVIAACGMERLNYQITEVKHLVVRHDWRGRGLGHFMVKRVLERINTPLIYATVRRDNLPSLSVFKSAGFEEASTYFNQDHDVVMLSRANQKWTPKPNWKSVSSHVAALSETVESSTPA